MKETLHTARFICTRLSPSFKDPARRKDVTGFRDTAAVSTAGPPRPLGKQPRPCAGEAAASPAARGRLVPVCPALPAALRRPAPTPRSCPRDPVPSTGRQSLRPGDSPCPVPASSKHCAPVHPATQTPTRTWSPGRTDRLCSPPLRAPPPARLRLGAAGCGRSARFPGTVTLTVLWQVSTRARPSMAFLEKLPRRRSSAARCTPSPVAQNCGQRAADAPGSFCKLPPPAGARAGAGECARGRC